MDILALLQSIRDTVSTTTLRQMSRVIPAMLAMTGRVTMLGISRWAGRGGSYRTVQRFFSQVIPWAEVFWAFVAKHLLDLQDAYLLAGDETVITKAGRKTYGLDRFFSSLMRRAVPGLSFFALSSINVRERRSYPVRVEQMLRTPEEKAASRAKRAKKQVQKKKGAGAKRSLGRPKGSRNKDKANPVLNPELQRIQRMIQAFLATLAGKLALTYLVLDGHFGNNPALQMVLQCQLQLISKLRADAALFFPYVGRSPKRGPRRRLGKRVVLPRIPEKYLKAKRVEDGVETRIYQAAFLLREFPGPLNVVIILKTHVKTKAQAHVILFSSDLELTPEALIDYYSLRFQIEFNFRDAKQFWGLEDFMNVTPTAVTNAANLSLFMVDVSQVLMCDDRSEDPNWSVLDLKARYRGYRYVLETIKMLPPPTDPNLVAQLFQAAAALGRIHPAKTILYSA
jgi:hypothetical protein